MKKRNPLDIHEQISLLQHLAINEIIEFTSPLTFFLSFLGAYYGPNSSLLGNINNDMWQFKKVEDIEHFLTNVLIIFFTDLCSVSVSVLVLWTFCRINFFKAIMAIEKEFSLVMVIILGYLVFVVRARFFIILPL